MENQYYIYKWFIKESGFVFYIGKGCKNRWKTIKKRSQYFQNYIKRYDCASEIIEYCASEDEAFIKEKEYIAQYKAIGMATTNFHEGGLGGNVWKYSDASKYEDFCQRMTLINQQRCSSNEFKERARQNMIARYQDAAEREIQSAKQRAAWTPEKRQMQSEILKSLPDKELIYAKRSEKMSKTCRVEYDSQVFDFGSRKEMLRFLKETYGFELSRKKEQELLRQKTPYVAFHSKYAQFNGLKMYYL